MLQAGQENLIGHSQFPQQGCKMSRRKIGWLLSKINLWTYTHWSRRLSSQFKFFSRVSTAGKYSCHASSDATHFIGQQDSCPQIGSVTKNSATVMGQSEQSCRPPVESCLPASQGVMFEARKSYAVTRCQGRLSLGCCHHDCTNMERAYEAALCVRLCSGCNIARYCSVKVPKGRTFRQCCISSSH